MAATLNGTAAAVVAVFSGLVLAAGPRRGPNQFLAAFLGLISANQATEAFRSIGSFGADLGLYRAATVFAALDPFFLYYFASIYPGRSSLNRPGPVLVVLAGSAAFAAWASVFPIPELGGGSWYVVETGLAGFTAIVYTRVLFHFVGGVGKGNAQPASRLLFAAMTFAAFPVWVRFLIDIYYALSLIPGIPHPTHSATVRAIQIAGWLVVLAWLALALRRRVGRTTSADPSDARWVVAWSVAAGLLAAVLYVQAFYSLLSALGVTPRGEQLSVINQAGGALRWLIFSALVSVAVLRFHMLGISLTARRHAARILVAFSFLVMAGLLVVFGGLVVGEGKLEVRPTELVLLLLIVVVSQTFRTLVGQVAAAVYGVPSPGDASAAVRTYQQAVVQSIEHSEPLESNPELLRLQHELGIHSRDAHVLRRMVYASSPGALVAGGLVLGRYRIIRLLGRGSSGRAFLAHDELIDRKVVVKEVSASTTEDEMDALREARLAGALQHPNIVTVYDVVSLGSSWLIVTEYVEHGSLADRLAQRGPLHTDEALDFFDGILSGLSALHERGVIHRDLKPQNLLVSGHGFGKISDFGIARIRRGLTRRAGSASLIEGTPGFLAPEVLRGEPASSSGDIYALGAVMRRSIVGPLPGTLKNLLATACDSKRSRRWASANEFLAELRRLRPSIVRAGAKRDLTARREGGRSSSQRAGSSM